MPVTTRGKSGNEKGVAWNLKGNESCALKKNNPALYKKLKPTPSARKWYEKQGYEWPICCTVENCRNLTGEEVVRKGKKVAIAAVGAHVYLEGDKHKIFLLPACQACNKSPKESLKYIGIPVLLCELTDEELAELADAISRRDEPKVEVSEKAKRGTNKAKTNARNNARDQKASLNEEDDASPPRCGAPCPSKKSKSPCKNYKGRCRHHD